MKKRIEIIPSTKALIFDIDGTLAITMPSHYNAFVKVLKKYNIDFTLQMMDEIAGVPVVPQMEKFKQVYNPDNFDPIVVAREKEDEFKKTINETQPLEPVMNVLKEYYQKLPIACGTGSDSETATKTLEVIGAKDMVSVLVACDHVENGKPAPDTFLKCAEMLGVDPRFCQVFEDGEPGIEAAKAAGMLVTDVREYI